MEWHDVKSYWEFFFGPYTCILFWGCMIGALFAYIFHKTKEVDEIVPFENKLKKWGKVVLWIYLIPSIIGFLFLVLYPYQTIHFLRYWGYKIFDNILAPIGMLIVNHKYVSIFAICYILALVFVADLLHQSKSKINRRYVVGFTVIITPLIAGFMYLATKIDFDPITIILLIGLPGALLSFLKK